MALKICFKQFKVFKLLSLIAIVGSIVPALATPGGSGGGDRYVQDFILTGKAELVPWLYKNGQNLVPQISADSFKNEINSLVENRNIISQEFVHESCNGSGLGRAVEVCFNADQGKFIISRSLYPLDFHNSASKRRLVAHEIFRKMGLEGDDYIVSNQMQFVDAVEIQPGQMLQVKCVLNYENSVGVYKRYSIATHRATDGVRTQTQFAISTQLTVGTDFFAEVLSYSPELHKLPRIYLWGYDADFLSSSTIGMNGKAVAHFSRKDGQSNPTRSIHAECEIF